MMKKFLLLFLFCGMFIGAFAATQTEPTGPVDISAYFVGLTYFVPGIVIVTQFVLSFIKVNGQVVSWLVAIIASAFGWFLQIGMFADLEWYWIIIYGLAAGLAANGVSDIPVIDGILLLVLPKKKDKEALEDVAL